MTRLTFKGGVRGEMAESVLRVYPSIKHLRCFWRGTAQKSGRLYFVCQKITKATF